MKLISDNGCNEECTSEFNCLTQGEYMLESIIKTIAFSTGMVDLLSSFSYSMATTY